MAKHGIAGIPPAQESPPASAEKPKQISKKVRAACELLLTGECATQQAAADAVGITREHLCKQLGKGHVRDFVGRETRKFIEQAQMKAAATAIALLDATSEAVRRDAAFKLLGISGIKEPERAATTINIGISPGYEIDLTEQAPKPVSPTIIDVTPNVNEGET